MHTLLASRPRRRASTRAVVYEHSTHYLYFGLITNILRPLNTIARVFLVWFESHGTAATASDRLYTLLLSCTKDSRMLHFLRRVIRRFHMLLLLYSHECDRRLKTTKVTKLRQLKTSGRPWQFAQLIRLLTLFSFAKYLSVSTLEQKKVPMCPDTANASRPSRHWFCANRVGR